MVEEKPIKAESVLQKKEASLIENKEVFHKQVKLKQHSSKPLQYVNDEIRDDVADMKAVKRGFKALLS